jgi:hypothetical protein
MPLGHNFHNKTVDEYRQLAQKFREIARMTLGEDDGRDLFFRSEDDRQVSLPRSWATSEAYPSAAAQTRIVSRATIRLDSRKSMRSFKEIICDDISEFESFMPSQAVRL